MRNSLFHAIPMKSGKRLFSFLFSIFIIIAQGQERVEISGQLISEDETLTYFDEIRVTNQSTYKIVTTHSDGKFYIEAYIGDVINFSSYAILSRSVRITETMYKNKYMKINVNTKEKELDEIHVSSYSKSLEHDVKNISMMNKSNQLLENIGMRGIGSAYDGKVNDWKPLESIMNPQALYDLVSGEQNKRKKLYAYEDQMEIIKEIEEYLGEPYFTDLGISKENLNEFLVYSYLNFDLKTSYKKKEFLTIMNELEKSSIQYKKLKGEKKKY